MVNSWNAHTVSKMYLGHQLIMPQIVAWWVPKTSYVNGNTKSERIRKQDEKTTRHDWINFDTIDEAMEFFNDHSGEFVDFYA